MQCHTEIEKEKDRGEVDKLAIRQHVQRPSVNCGNVEKIF
jgi:hypothetical protein